MPDTRSKKLCPKIILEGTRLTHKTDVAVALNERPRVVGARKYRYHSPVIPAGWCGFTNRPWGRGLINFEATEEARAQETYEAWMRLFELQLSNNWIIDRFHLSTRLYQRQARGMDYNCVWLVARRLPLGFQLVLCHRRPEAFEAARGGRLRVSGNPS